MEGKEGVGIGTGMRKDCFKIIIVKHKKQLITYTNSHRFQLLEVPLEFAMARLIVIRAERKLLMLLGISKP